MASASTFSGSAASCLDADCAFRGRDVRVTFATGDPIFPAAEGRRFDSKIEERFARDFGRAAQGWSIVREPEPVQAGRHLVFPDFAVFRRTEPHRRWFVEIAGFWTPEYLADCVRKSEEPPEPWTAVGPSSTPLHRIP